MSTIAQIFGSTLQRMRAQRGITQRELGAFTRISPTFIGEMERGLKAPNLESVVALARALQVGLDEMMAGFPTRQSIRAAAMADPADAP
jgi:transcriptional regulator with XRE-family HTH domain